MIYYNLILDLKNDILNNIEIKDIENARKLKLYIKNFNAENVDIKAVFKQSDKVYIKEAIIEYWQKRAEKQRKMLESKQNKLEKQQTQSCKRG